MRRPRVVAFCGNLHRPSRARALVEAFVAELARHRAVEAKVYDVLHLGPGFGSALMRADLPLPAARVVEAVEGADALVVGTPVHRGAYTGPFKHLVDFLEPERLAGKPVALTAVGGGPRHAPVVEHQRRPLFGFFSSLTIPTAVDAAEADLARTPDEAGYAVADPTLAARIGEAARQLATLTVAPALGADRLAAAR